jgi:1-deoxy-D-xylulose-5-phosphate reductoisomerase
MTRIAILGSTGSIGESTLQVVRQSEGKLKIVGLSAHTNIEKLSKQATEFGVKNFFLTSDNESRMVDLATDKDTDVVVIAIVGFAALKPTLAAIEAGKRVALANKEALVTCGELLTSAAKKSGAQIIPVDSEHNALFQALQGHSIKNVEKLWLTGSGGPFRGKTRKDLELVDIKSALNHPNWKMGPKITIDSASLMNKGLEFIEAHWIFNVPAQNIDVLIHPQSLVHGMVEFIDGSLLAYLSACDMKAAISYALCYPDRLKNAVKPLNLSEIRKLEFEPVDYSTFPCVMLAKQALQTGGLAPTALNAANEVAVDAFLKEKIRFLDIPDLISKTLDAAPKTLTPGSIDWDGIYSMDAWARQKAHENISSLRQ